MAISYTGQLVEIADQSMRLVSNVASQTDINCIK